MNHLLSTFKLSLNTARTSDQPPLAPALSGNAPPVLLQFTLLISPFIIPRSWIGIPYVL